MSELYIKYIGVKNKNNIAFVNNNIHIVFAVLKYLSPKNKLYIPDIAIFPIKELRKPINKITNGNIGFVLLNHHVCDIESVNTHHTKDNITKSNIAITQPIASHIKTFPVSHRPDVWLGSLVNQFFLMFIFL